MGGRYLVTGVQLGLLKAISEDNDVHDLIEKIIDHQFVFHRESWEDKSIQDDVKLIGKLFVGRKEK